MKTEPADQFAAAKARAPRLGGYGESAVTLLDVDRLARRAR